MSPKMYWLIHYCHCFLKSQFSLFSCTFNIPGGQTIMLGKCILGKPIYQPNFSLNIRMVMLYLYDWMFAFALRYVMYLDMMFITYASFYFHCRTSCRRTSKCLAAEILATWESTLMWQCLLLTWMKQAMGWRHSPLMSLEGCKWLAPPTFFALRAITAIPMFTP